MINFTTNVEMLDRENENLFKAAKILESLGNTPGLRAEEFYNGLELSGYHKDDHETIALAAIAIEAMMTVNLQEDELHEPTVH